MNKNKILDWHRWYEDDNYVIIENLYEENGIIKSEFMLGIYKGDKCTSKYKYKFNTESIGRSTFIKLKNIKSDYEIQKYIYYLIQKTEYLTKI